MPDRRRQIVNLLEEFRAIQQSMVKAGQSISGKLSITFTQFILLTIVSENEGSSIKKLASIMGITSSGATQQVDSLEKKGYLVRKGSPEDRRALALYLSTETKKELNRLQKRHIDDMSSVYNALSDEEFQTFCALSKKIVSTILEK